MKVATRTDKPDWLTPPSGIVTATVCRVSGKLATDGCRDVASIGPDGLVERRSMVYTEYFARGTEPHSYCDLHSSPGILTKVASVIGVGTSGDRPAAPRIDTIGIPAGPPSAPVVASDPDAVPPPPPAQAKRGFWSRIFGLGRKGESRTPDTPQPKKKSGG